MRERFAAWFVTGPLGPLASGVADGAVLLVALAARGDSVTLARPPASPIGRS